MTLLSAASLSLRAAPADVQIEMKNVRLHPAEGIVLDIAYRRGTMVSRKAGTPPVFDDQQSYVLRYNAQLVAGYSKNTPQKGLKTYMPDYDDIQAGAKRQASR